jgi:hypothetical protein
VTAVSLSDARTPFVEPTRSVPLAWGTYRSRITATYAVAALACLAVPAATPVSAILSGFVFLAVLVVFAVVPAELRRRLIAVGGIILATVALAVLSQATGLLEIGQWQTAPSIAVPAAVVAAWLFVRRRPAIAYIVVPLSLLVAISLGVAGAELFFRVVLTGSGVGLDDGVTLFNIAYAAIPPIAVVVPVLLGRLIAGVRAGTR